MATFKRSLAKVAFIKNGSGFSGDAVRFAVVAAGLVVVLSGLPGASPGDPWTVAVLLLATLGAEALAIRRATSAGVVSLSFVPLTVAVLLVGWQPALSVAVAGVLLGD